MTDEVFELLSAYLDGEATLSERARVESSTELMAEVDRLRAVAGAVARVTAPSDATREAIIAAALAEFDTNAPAEPLIPVPSLAGRRAHRWMPAIGAAAAAIVVIGGFAVTRLGNSSGGEDATERMDAVLSVPPPVATTTATNTEPVVMASAPAPPLPTAPGPVASSPVATGNVQVDAVEADDVFEAAAPPAPEGGSGPPGVAASEFVPADAAPSAAAPSSPVVADGDDVRTLARDLGSLPAIADARRACRAGSLTPSADYQPSDDRSVLVVIVTLSDGRLGVLTLDECRLVSTIDP